jgi:hypothetical protein
MLYFLLIISALAAGILALRLRVRFEWTEDGRILFVGLGRTGLRMDYGLRRKVFTVAGMRLITSELKKKEAVQSPAEPPPDEPSEVIPGKKPTKPAKPPGKRKRPLSLFLKATPRTGKAAATYLYNLLKDVVIEECKGKIEAGFESPDLTGAAYGFYQAALAGAPGAMGRFQFAPDFTGRSFRGELRLAAALPLYRLAYRTIALIAHLPLRDLTKLAIGQKRGGQDGQ